MKLISLYIENFGCLTGFSLSFEEGVTVVNQPNGFGKTTLAEFIRAMFYGFPRKTKALEKSRRQKYAPWNGGKCGGNLTFSLEGKQYRIERTFGATPKTDTFTLIDLDDNRKSSRFSEEIGLELFGLDSDSFERSTYMPQIHDASCLTTNAIQAKLSNLVEDTNDINNYDKAVEALRAKRSALVPYRGTGGSIANAQSHISALQAESERCRNQQEALDTCEAATARWEQALERSRQELEALREQIVAASARAACVAAKQQYARMEEQLSADQARAASLGTLVMEPALLEELTKDARERVKAQHQLELLNREDESGELEMLHQMFAAGVPSEDVFLSGQQYLARIGGLQQEKLLLSATMPEDPAPKKQSVIPVLLLLLGIGAAATGIVLLVQRLFWAGGIVLGLGIGLLTAAAYLGIRQMVSRELEPHQGNRPGQMRMEAIDGEIIVLERLLGELVQPYTGTQPLSRALDELRSNVRRYQQLLASQAERRKEQSELETEIARLDTRLSGFFGNENPEDALLRRKIAREQYRQIQDRIQDAEKEMEAFRQKHAAELAVSPAPTQDLASLQKRERQLTEQITTLTGQILAGRQRMERLREEVNRVPELESELEVWQRAKEDGQRNARLLDETLALLDSARKNLQSSYLAPIREKFDSYMNRLMAENREKILVTPELDVQLERFGQSRELGYFSAGQVDVVMLCMRFALVDALFGDGKPFVILDDPFVNLDDRSVAEALELLREFARERQILYLVCHSSRSI